MEGLVIPGLASVFRGKRVFVTGDTGFKGSWLALWLHELGAEVMGYALAPQRPDDHFNLLRLDRLIRHKTADVRNGDRLCLAMRGFQPEFVFHLAAQSLVRVSYEQPKPTFDTNVAGSVNILEAVRNTPSVRVLIYVTSDKCYLNKELLRGYRESDVLGGRDPYSASKAAAEIVFEAYRRSFFEDSEKIGVASVRAGNVIGGGDWSKDRVVPDCIRALRANRPIELRNPGATRPWLHVLEPLGGYLLLASRLRRSPRRFSGSWNFGPRSEATHTVKDVAHGILRGWGKGRIVVKQSKRAPHEATLLNLNCNKARFNLDWQPAWDFERTVRETVQWYKGLADGEAARTLSRQQIRRYMEGER